MAAFTFRPCKSSTDEKPFASGVDLYASNPFSGSDSLSSISLTVLTALSASPFDCGNRELEVV